MFNRAYAPAEREWHETNFCHLPQHVKRRISGVALVKIVAPQIVDIVIADIQKHRSSTFQLEKRCTVLIGFPMTWCTLNSWLRTITPCLTNRTGIKRGRIMQAVPIVAIGRRRRSEPRDRRLGFSPDETAHRVDCSVQPQPEWAVRRTRWCRKRSRPRAGRRGSCARSSNRLVVPWGRVNWDASAARHTSRCWERGSANSPPGSSRRTVPGISPRPS